MQASIMATDPTIAILSGKGGTGKTLLSVNLSSVAAMATYIDCDVEEPNGNLFFKPSREFEKLVTVKKPVVDETLCDGCHKCVDFCAFNALALIGKRLMIFDEICHSCGGCIYVCPQKALSESERPIGEMSIGHSGSVRCISGTMNIGESSGVPIIEALLKHKDGNLTIIDAPPGSSCLVTESIRLADFCILVAEPTIFGSHNLAMVHQLVTLLGKKHAVVLNKTLEGVNPSEEYCKKNNIPILGNIPFDKRLGKMNSEGRIAAREDAHYHKLFSAILEKALKEVSDETAADPQR
ncbi:ATP-binding protein [Sphaerochaeta sp. PS]|uniref:ATP-binding protein n=1 Tax=Sphaerochaeta sp. PS TaxID=3076336 RepID=UPI0028A36DA7|nr:ATP-binding protein [Sphaerochaeta sp. PS]MDT4762548.1 ATP-binding protein [Sphaerochaeta sp. PS]